jgi:hypothetical protein
MKKIFLAIACFITIGAFSQSDYWQQQVNYKINVSLNDQKSFIKRLRRNTVHQQFRRPIKFYLVSPLGKCL